MEKEWVHRNVAALRKAPELPPSPVVACTDDELRGLLDALEEGCDLWAAIVLGAGLGRRLGQLCEIRWSDVDLERRTVTVQPTRKSPMPVALGLDLGTARRLDIRRCWQEERRERVFGDGAPLSPDAWVLSFRADGSGPFGRDGYNHAFGDLRDEFGLRHLHFHCLRHWCATTLKMSDVAPDASFDTVRDRRPPGAMRSLRRWVLASTA